MILKVAFLTLKNSWMKFLSTLEQSYRCLKFCTTLTVYLLFYSVAAQHLVMVSTPEIFSRLARLVHSTLNESTCTYLHWISSAKLLITNIFNYFSCAPQGRAAFNAHPKLPSYSRYNECTSLHHLCREYGKWLYLRVPLCKSMLKTYDPLREGILPHHYLILKPRPLGQM